MPDEKNNILYPARKPELEEEEYKAYKNPNWYADDELGVYASGSQAAQKRNAVDAVTTPLGSGTAALDNLVGDSRLISPEEEEKRKRRAEAAAAVGNLGKLMSGFANLYYVNKGASSQVLPNDVMPDYMSFQDRVTRARREALNNEIARENLLLNQRKEDRMNAKHELDVRKQEWREQYERGRLDIQSEKNRIDEMYKNKLIERWERDYYLKELDAATRARNAATAEANAATNAQNAATRAATEARIAGGSSRTETNNGLSKTVETTWNNGGGSGQSAGSGGGKQSSSNSGKKKLGVNWVTK